MGGWMAILPQTQHKCFRDVGEGDFAVHKNRSLGYFLLLNRDDSVGIMFAMALVSNNTISGQRSDGTEFIQRLRSNTKKIQIDEPTLTTIDLVPLQI